MPDIQGGYSAAIPAAYEGQVADPAGAVRIALTNETADVTFGSAMVAGTAANSAKVGAAGHFVGLAIREPALPIENGDKYQIGDGVSLLLKGAMWVKTLAIAAVGDPVYRTAAGALTPTAAGSTLVADAYFETAAAANGLARIRLR
jgi:hypothetical protein